MKNKCSCGPSRPIRKKVCCPKGVEIDYVEIPASLGTSAPGQPNAPENGAYKNAVVKYAADGAVFIYTSEGIPVRLGSGGGGGGEVFSVNGKTGDVVLTTSDLQNTSGYVTGTQVIADINSAIGGLATVARTGSYNDLQDLPTIPTKVSQLQNDSGYQTASQVSTAVGGEANLRIAADSNLQGQIDAIAASSDVTDIVGTYADLQAYDTQHLKDNDIIKVLQDESQNDETTYYRWSTSTQSFTLIGEEGPYYTKSAADLKFQDKLIAGTNIQIANDGKTISATDTTYTAGTNVSISSANQISAKAKTIFYVNVLETGTTKHIYKDDSFTTAATAQEIITAIENTAVMVSMLDSNSPTEFNMLALENYWDYTGDIQFIFTDGNNLYDFGCSATTDTTFDYSTGALQKKLTAGTNVSIVGTTISATDTTYSAFVGTDGQTAGTAGLVPAPATTDTDKFLKSDGTWDTAGGGSSVTVVQTTGTSQTDVMSQVATSQMIYPSGYETSKTRIGIGGTPSANNSISIGGESTSKSQAVSIGYRAGANGYSATAAVQIGYNTRTSNQNDIAIGYNSQMTGDDSIGIGANTNNTYGTRGVVSLGSGAKATRTGEVNIGSSSTSNGYNSTNYRVLGGVHPGIQDHDATTLGQVDARILANGTTAPTTTTVGEVGTLCAYVSGTTGHLAICTEIDTTDPDNPVYTWSTLI